MPCETFNSGRIGYPPHTDVVEFARAAAKAFNLPPYSVVNPVSDAKRWGTASVGVELIDITYSVDRGHYTYETREMSLRSYGLSAESSLYASFGDRGASCIACSPSDDVVLTILVAFERLTLGHSWQ
ncbi:MAG: hypothetical protein FJW32_29845 [Acidobacteria bacterium]|nr:hypothetical protein [Acidobacteriota bacterium]